MVAPSQLLAIDSGLIPRSGGLAGPAPTKGQEPSGAALWGEDGFTFGDLVDLVNPLQHIPVVSWAYRAITGDQIAPGAMALGGGIFGGVAGLAAGVLEAVVQGATGKDPGAHLLALFQGNETPESEPPNIAVADATSDGDIPTLSLDQLDLLVASFNGQGPTSKSLNPGLALPPGAASILSTDEAALLLASINAPAMAPGTPSNSAQTKNAGAIPGFGGMTSTANPQSLFLPLVPFAGAGPDTAPKTADRRLNPEKTPVESEANVLPRDGAVFAAAINAGIDIRTFFGL